MEPILVTVSDGERLKRNSLTPEERSAWAVKAWQLMDEEDMTSRSISRKWQAEHGFYVSHVTITKWVHEVRKQEKLLDLYEPEQVRLGLLGKLERYQESIHAAIDTQEIPFDVGMKMLLAVARDIAKLTNAAVAPTAKVEVRDERVTPDLILMEELRKAKEHAKRMDEMEETDGLDG